MIISASRRTDIPAFYSEWFINQIKNGVFIRKNPYNGQLITNEFKPEDIQCIVFWTRNPRPMLKHGYLDYLDELGIPYYFQYTITGYPKAIEKHVKHPLNTIDTFNELAERIGGEKVIWRFDPILLSQYTPVEELLRLHGKIASMIHSDTQQNVISFLDDYQKTGRNLKLAGIESRDILAYPDELHELLTGISETANKHHLHLSTCAENIDLEKYGIAKGKCIDGDFIKNVLGVKVSKAKDQGQRKECGCVKSIDVGLYDTCVHGCHYCYATQSQSDATQHFKNHDPNNPLIIPDNEALKHLNFLKNSNRII